MAFLWRNLVAQFQTPHPSQYPDVYSPLESARRHKSVSSAAESWGKKDADAERLSPSSDDEETRRESRAYDIHTMEGLRAQLDHDATAFGTNSTYDRMCIS